MSNKNDDKLSSKIIYRCECELLKSEVRKSAKRINELLAKDFIEFMSSGDVAFYEVGEVFQENNDNTELNWEIRDFKVR